MHAVWTREQTTILTTTTALSELNLSVQALSDTARASPSVRFLLPRLLLKKAFAPLAAAEKG